MIILLVLILGGIAAALFGTQNTQVTSISFGQTTFSNIPVYLIALGSLLLGILVSWLINIIGAISASLAMRGKEMTITQAQKEIVDLRKQVHKLELENARLEAQHGENDVDDNSL